MCCAAPCLTARGPQTSWREIPRGLLYACTAPPSTSLRSPAWRLRQEHLRSLPPHMCALAWWTCDFHTPPVLTAGRQVWVSGLEGRLVLSYADAGHAPRSSSGAAQVHSPRPACLSCSGLCATLWSHAAGSAGPAPWPPSLSLHTYCTFLNAHAAELELHVQHHSRATHAVGSFKRKAASGREWSGRKGLRPWAVGVSIAVERGSCCRVTAPCRSCTTVGPCMRDWAFHMYAGLKGDGQAARGLHVFFPALCRT